MTFLEKQGPKWRVLKGGKPGTPSPLAEVEKLELADLVQDQLKCLNRRARIIICQRFELDGRAKYTLQQLGEKLEITRERVRQIEASTLVRLANRWRGKALQDYLEG